MLCLCPLEEGSIELAKELIQQTRSMHPDATYIHIGCDEVFNLGDCARWGPGRVAGCSSPLRKELSPRQYDAAAMYGCALDMEPLVGVSYMRSVNCSCWFGLGKCSKGVHE